MHARAGIGRGQLVLQSRKHVVGVEHGIFGGLAQPVGPVAEHIGQGAHEHAHLAVKPFHAAKALLRLAILTVMFDQSKAVRPMHHERHRCEGRQGI